MMVQMFSNPNQSHFSMTLHLHIHDSNWEVFDSIHSFRYSYIPYGPVMMPSLGIILLIYVVWKRNNSLVQNLIYNNSSLPSDAIWRHKSRSTLAQVMVWCRQDMKQCRLIISEVHRRSFEGNFTGDTSVVNPENCLDSCSSQIPFQSPRCQWVSLMRCAWWRHQIETFSALQRASNAELGCFLRSAPE